MFHKNVISLTNKVLKEVSCLGLLSSALHRFTLHEILLVLAYHAKLRISFDKQSGSNFTRCGKLVKHLRKENMSEQAVYPSLKGKTVLITGGASGIGEALTRAFFAQGCNVGFLDFDQHASDKLVADLDADNVLAVQCDLRDIEALQAGVKEVSAKLGHINVLVNNAARDDRHSLESVTSEYFDERIATNLKHQLFASQAVVADMEAAGGGAIINMGSTSWMIGQGGMPCYTTAKSAIQGLTRGLARDLGPKNIRVNCLVPGWIMTERQVSMWLTEESEKELMQRQCVKRKLVPEDIARFALFMASDEASACSNQTYIVDGGWV